MQAEQQLLAVHVSTLLSKGFKPLMSGHRVHDLARMYSLLNRVGGADALREEWRQYIVTTGTAIVKDEANVSDLRCWGLLSVCSNQAALFAVTWPHRCCQESGGFGAFSAKRK
jgi:hypothetical protein